MLKPQFTLWLKGLLSIGICLSLCFLQYSCRSYDKKAELKQLDSLEFMINQAAEILVIDENVISKRRDSLLSEVKYINDNLKSQPTEEVEHGLNTALGISSNYEHFLKEYPSEVYDNLEIAKRIAKLRSTYVGGKLTNVEFAKNYKVEKPLISSHFKDVKETANKVIHIENQYYRSSAALKQFCEELRKTGKIKDKGKSER